MMGATHQPYRMNIQHVDVEVIRGQIYALKHLLEAHRLALAGADQLVAVSLHHLFDEAQQMLLVHTAGRVNMGVYLNGRQRARLPGSNPKSQQIPHVDRVISTPVLC